MSQKTYLFKARLKGPGGRPYRLLEVPAEFTLYDLALFILDAFDFDDDHLFGFYDNIRRWINSTDIYELFQDDKEEVEYDPEFPEIIPRKNVTKIRVNEAFNEVGKKLLFLFDYGDNWHFIIQFEGTNLAKKEMEYPLVLKSVGKAPSQYDVIDDDGDW